MTEAVQGTFVSQKISKIRWKPEGISESKYFVTGSWDDRSNGIGLWVFQNNDEEEISLLNLALLPVMGDVTEIRFISQNQFVASSAVGNVNLYKVQNEPFPDIKELNSWNSIHMFSGANGYKSEASCTALSTFEEDIVTVGEDGRIVLLTAQNDQPVRKIDEADSCALSSVDFLRHSEILTGNVRGHMKVWDLRSNQNTPSTSIMLSEQTRTEATCIAHHPTQKHLVVAGGGDGSLTVWDLRYNTYPISQLTAHAKSVNEILFHQNRPENLYTCSNSGELWHWNNTQNVKLNLDITDTHWLNTIGNQKPVQVNSLCNALHKPINSIDIDRSTILFACDNEAIYFLKNLKF